MRKFVKWLGIALAALAGLLVILVLAVVLISNGKMSQRHVIDVKEVPVPTDAASIARGEHIARSVAACVGCHGEQFEGKLFIDDPALGKFWSRNLTSGQGGVGSSYTDKDWVGALRHGIHPDGRALWIMPAQGLYYMNDQDLGDLIAFLKSLPPVDNETPDPQPGPIGRVLVAGGMIKPAVEILDHSRRPAAPAAGITVEYGEYLSQIANCRDCHGPNLAGGVDPNAPVGPNLTRGGQLIAWDEAIFLSALRGGTTPAGRPLDPELMPWKEYGGMTDDELKAFWVYLESLPDLETNPPPSQ